MKKTKNTGATLFSEHHHIKYKKISTGSRKNFEKEFEPLKSGTVIKEARKYRLLTQEKLALKSGTTKFYISRVENNSCDIRLSTLMKIIQKGLGGKLKFSAELQN